MNPVARQSSVGQRACAAAGVALAGLCCTGFVAAQSAPAGGSVYTCIDRLGRRLTADRPIPECNDREQRVLDQTGAERRRMGPALTENERAAAEAQQQRESAERARVAEERRRERVLAARYPTPSAHDAERASVLARVDDVTAVTQKHVDDLLRDRKKLEAELAAYASTPGKAPMALRRQLAEQDQALERHRHFVAAQEAEKRRVNQRFDVERAVLQPIWAANPAVPEAAAAER